MGNFLNRPKAAFLSLLFLTSTTAVSIVCLAWIYHKKLETLDTISKTYNNLINLEKINLGLHQANSQKNGFVLTGFEYYLDSYKKTVQEIPAKIDTFKTTNSTDGNGSKNSLTSLEFIVEQNIYGMDSVLKNREASGLEGLKYTAYLGKESGTFKEFESKKVIFKKAEKNTIQEKMIILTRWNILFFAASILSIALILAELFLIYMIRRKWKSIQAI